MAFFARLDTPGAAISAHTTFPGFGSGLSQAWAFGAWIRTRTASQDLVVILVGDGATDFRVYLEGNKICLYVAKNGWNDPFSLQSSDVRDIADGQWHYVGVALYYESLWPLQCDYCAYFIKDDAVVEVLSGVHRAPSPESAAAGLVSAAGPEDAVSAEGRSLKVVLHGDISCILLSRWPSHRADPTRRKQVNSWFRTYRDTGPGASDFKRDGADVFCPFYECLGPMNRTNNVVNNQPLTLSGATIAHDQEAFLDGFSELSLYTPSGPFTAVHPGAFRAIMQTAPHAFSKWTLEQLRGPTRPRKAGRCSPSSRPS